MKNICAGGDTQWYRHLFDGRQPDPNWNHPEARAEFEDQDALDDHFATNAGFPTHRKLTLCHTDRPGVCWEIAMSVYVDEGFRPCVTECATVAFRVCFDDRAQIFEVSAEALIRYCGAASRRRTDLLIAFEDAQLEILKVAELRQSFKPAEPIKLGLDEFRMVMH